MAADFKTQYLVAADPAFQQRVSSAVAIVAVGVYIENPATTGHAARAAYAVSVIVNPPLAMVTVNELGISQPDRTVFGVARLLAAQGLDNNSSDAAIQAQLQGDWNALAGV
jgi:cell division septation protein DedD